MKIITISDTHNRHLDIKIPDGDIIIHAGDISGRGRYDEIEEFMRWYGDLPHAYRILIAGNHDFGFERDPETFEDLCKSYGVTYLNDSGTTIQGIKIWGSPVTPEFYDWAFNRSIHIDPDDIYHRRHPHIKPHWDKIPEDTQILITHGPPRGILDMTKDGMEVGCPFLLKKLEKVRPVMHVFGHIHEARGIEVKKLDGKVPTTFVNASSLNRFYGPFAAPAHSFDWEKLVVGGSDGED